MWQALSRSLVDTLKQSSYLKKTLAFRQRILPENHPDIGDLVLRLFDGMLMTPAAGNVKRNLATARSYAAG
jgi:flavoprotein